MSQRVFIYGRRKTETDKGRAGEVNRETGRDRECLNDKYDEKAL